MTEGEQRGDAPSGLPAGLAALVAQAGDVARPRPVERWNPPDCGAIDLRIAANGTWFYAGTPIGRQSLVRLFASILRREPDGGYVLVTPVEKVGITVEDAPFRAVELSVAGQGAVRTLTFRTDMGDLVTAGTDHPLRFAIEPGTGGLKPYLLVRGRLEALLTRPVMHEIVNLGDERDGASGVWSGGSFFPFPAPGDTCP